MNHITSLLIGTAVGDSLGLPTEGMSRNRVARRLKHGLRQSLIFGKGMISDDTEHAVFTTLALRKAKTPEEFQKLLSGYLQLWFLCIPVGVGLATLRACLKLLLGLTNSGVFSAGNGPMMRSPAIGAYLAQTPEKISEYVRQSTRLTHTDPKAEYAALAVALTTAFAVTHTERPNQEEVLALWEGVTNDVAWQELITKMRNALKVGCDVQSYASLIGYPNAVTGYCYSTAPVVLYAWLVHYGDYAAGVEAVIRCGGDTDSTGAIVGALLALNAEVPTEWIKVIKEYPLSVDFLNQLGECSEASKQPSINWWVMPFRSGFLLALVLYHLLRRWLNL